MKELGLMCGERKERGDCNDVTGHVTVQCYMRDMRDGEEWDVRRHDSHIHTRKVLKTRLVVDRDKPRNFDFGFGLGTFFCQAQVKVQVLGQVQVMSRSGPRSGPEGPRSQD